MSQTPVPSTGTPLQARQRCPRQCAGDAGFQPPVPADQGLILNSLRLGEWKPAKQFPAKWSWRHAFVSVRHVRKAIDELAARICSCAGKARHFVATHAEQQVQYRFLKLIPDNGDTSSEGPPSAGSLTANAFVHLPTWHAHWPCAPGPGAAGTPRSGLCDKRPFWKNSGYRVAHSRAYRERLSDYTAHVRPV